MSDTNVRGITGLTPRKVDPKRMLAANRGTDSSTAPPTAEASAAPSAPETPREATSGATVAAETEAAATTPTRKPSTSVQGAQGRVSTYIDAQIRARVVAAFKATSHLEGDESFSAFVETALLNEAIRREQLHNGGDEFASAGKLQRGRPVRG